MRRWTEGHVHIRMRKALRDEGFELIAGEYPGGTDHELSAFCITDPALARDDSPDPRRASLNEIIPDIVALRDRLLVLGEAKVDYHDGDRAKLDNLLGDRRLHLLSALEKFALDRGFPQLLPVNTLTFLPTLVFTSEKPAPAPPEGFSYLILQADGGRQFKGLLRPEGKAREIKPV